MEMYIGTKLVKSKVMNRQEYNDFRGWTLPNDEDGADEGYFVEYLNSNKDNIDNYTSWFTKEAFEKVYKAIEGLDFGMAIRAMNRGLKVCREGWNGKGMFIFLVQGSTFKVNRKPLLGIYKEGHEINYQSHIDMCTADGTIVPWLCSQSDMLATDWRLEESERTKYGIQV